MRCPALSELPSPRRPGTGWPWTEASVRLAERDLPRITVVTPSFNQADFLEETIRSVLLQGYPDLEYLVVDGGSTDGSLEIIRRYEPWISWWCSELDGGQADALNKGLGHATGRIFNWINSDDRLEPGALGVVARTMSGDVDAVAGACRFVYEAEGRVEVVANRGLDAVVMVGGSTGVTLCQPSLWLLTDRIREIGAFNAKSHYYFDAELFIRYLSRWPRVRYLGDPLSAFRIHTGSKTGSEPDGFRREYVRALRTLTIDAPTSKMRRLAARRLRELATHSRFLTVSRVPSLRRRIAAGLHLNRGDLHPSLLWVRLRWILSFIGVMGPPIGDVAELREIASWSELSDEGRSRPSMGAGNGSSRPSS